MSDNREIIEMLEVLKEQALKSHNDTAVLKVNIDSFNFVLDEAIKALEQEPCEDVISRQAMLDATVKKNSIWNNITNSKGENLEQIILQLPSITPKPKTGHWIKTPKAVMGEGYMWYCDKCEHQVYQDSSKDYPSEKYCPKCGARMVEPQESEDNGCI